MLKTALDDATRRIRLYDLQINGIILDYLGEPKNYRELLEAISTGNEENFAVILHTATVPELNIAFLEFLRNHYMLFKAQSKVHSGFRRSIKEHMYYIEETYVGRCPMKQDVRCKFSYKVQILLKPLKIEEEMQDKINRVLAHHNERRGAFINLNDYAPRK
jgi:hypothetical protein